MPFMDEFQNGGPPGISADRLNEPFHLVAASHDAGTDTLTITVGRGRAWFSDSLIEYGDPQQVQVTPVVANTTYYVYLTSGGLVVNTAASPTSGQVPLGAVQVGATKSTLTRIDRRSLIEATGSVVRLELAEHLGASSAHSASAISYAGSSNLSATNVEAALDELDAEKAPASHSHSGADITSAVANATYASNADTVDGVHAASFGRKDQANAWAQKQTFQVGPQIGDGNQDVSDLFALFFPRDTRSLVATAWDADLRPKALEYRDGATVVAAVSLTYNADGKLTQADVTAGGVTIRYTYSWDGEKFLSRSKVVI